MTGIKQPVKFLPQLRIAIKTELEEQFVYHSLRAKKPSPELMNKINSIRKQCCIEWESVSDDLIQRQPWLREISKVINASDSIFLSVSKAWKRFTSNREKGDEFEKALDLIINSTFPANVTEVKVKQLGELFGKSQTEKVKSKHISDIMSYYETGFSSHWNAWSFLKACSKFISAEKWNETVQMFVDKVPLDEVFEIVASSKDVDPVLKQKCFAKLSALDNVELSAFFGRHLNCKRLQDRHFPVLKSFCVDHSNALLKMFKSQEGKLLDVTIVVELTTYLFRENPVPKVAYELIKLPIGPQGKTFVHYPAYLKLLLPHLMANPHHFADIAHIGNAKGQSLVYDTTIVEALMPFFLQNPDLALDALKHSDLDGKTVLGIHQNYVLLQPFFQAHPDKFCELLEYQNKKGESLLHQMTPVLDTVPNRNLFPIFTVLNHEGETPLNRDKREITQRLTRLEPDELYKDLQIQDKDGNTLGHFMDVISATQVRVWCIFKKDRLTPEQIVALQNMPNNFGITPGMWKNKGFSLSWLTKSKKARTKPTVTLEQFGPRARALKTEVLALLHQNENRWAGYRLTNALSTILNRIESKTIWIGTPKENEPQALHEFYAEMLENFETALIKLKTIKTPSQVVDYLEGIARGELEGRCAAAYQAEIQQAKDLLEEGAEGLSVAALVERGACRALQAIVDEIVRTKHNSDVHSYTQYSYAVGLAAAPDPLSWTSVDRAQRDVISKCKSFEISTFKDSIDRIPQDSLSAWFKDHVPMTFETQNLKAQVELETSEKGLIASLESNLSKLQLNKVELQEVIKFCLSSRGAKYRITSKFNSPAIQAAIKMCPEMLNMTKAEELILLAAEKGLTPKVQPGKGFAESVAVRKQFTEDLEQLATQNEMMQALKKMLPKVKDLALQRIVKIKTDFDQSITKLSKEQGIAFIPSEHGLPSKGLDTTRKNAFAAGCFNEDKSVKPMARFYLLKTLGIWTAG